MTWRSWRMWLGIAVLMLGSGCEPSHEEQGAANPKPPTVVARESSIGEPVRGPFLVRDINTRSDRRVEPAHHPSGLISVGNTLFFTATDVWHGTELWKSDGTEAGTVRVKDIVPGPASAFPDDVDLYGAPLINLSGTLFFFVSQQDSGGSFGSELWKSDGTEVGTVRVMATAAWGRGLPQFVHASDGQVLFLAGDAAHGGELWRSDGTEAGTGLVVDLAPGPASSIEGALGSFGGMFYFFGHTGDGDSELWRTDGTAAGTTRVKDIRPGPEGSSIGYQALTVIGDGAFFFEADDGVHGVELWKSDGTEAGTALVKDITPGAGSSNFNATQWVDGRLFLSLLSSSGGELWTSDGTDAGTERVKVVSPAPGRGAPYWFREVNGLLLFIAADAAATASDTPELWRSDGTEAGTVMVKDITPGPAGSVQGLYVSGGKVFFTANDGVSGRELWKSDGTEAGTVRVKDIAPGSGSSLSVRRFRDVNGMLFFLADETGSAKPFQLWRSDGSEAGTVRVKDVSLIANSSNPQHLMDVDGTLFFAADDGVSGVELWKTDATVPGTVRVKDVRPGGEGSNPVPLLAFRGQLYFAANDGSGSGLWRSNGSEPGTVRVKQVTVLHGGTGGRLGLKELNGSFFFIGKEADGSFVLWRSDGTEGGTSQVKRFGPHGEPPELVVWGSSLFLSIPGSGLWKSDGTEAGTEKVSVLTPRELTPVGRTLFFVASEPDGGLEVWKSDGTGAGTVRVKDLLPGREGSSPSLLTAAGGTLFFVAYEWGYWSLWRTDGTEAGTVKLMSSLGSDNAFQELVAVGGTLFFQHYNIGKRELWKSDGTEAGTVRVKDIGSGDFSPQGLRRVGKRLFFSAMELETFHEPWVSDGTEAGTFRLGDIAPGRLTSFSRGFTGSGGRVFFSASAEQGAELWAVELDGIWDTLPPTLTCPEDVSREAGDKEGAAVNYGPVVAVDDFSDVRLDYSHLSGSLFPVGTTQVTVTARDEAGNAATCEFRVVLHHQEPESPPKPEGPRDRGCSAAPGILLGWALLALLPLSLRRRRRGE